MGHRKVKLFILKFWINTDDYSVRHGYTRESDDLTASLRIGPLVIGWEFINE